MTGGPRGWKWASPKLDVLCLRSVKAAQAETKLPHAQLGQLCILTGHLTLLGSRCQSTLIKRKQMGEVKMYLLISLTHGQAVRKTQRNKKNWYLPGTADQVLFPKLSIPPVWHQRSWTSLFDPHLASAIVLAHQYAWFVTTVLFPTSVFLTASSMPLLRPFGSSFFNSSSRGIYPNLQQELEI